MEIVLHRAHWVDTEVRDATFRRPRAHHPPAERRGGAGVSGSIQGSCGHIFCDDDGPHGMGNHVRYSESVCDAVDGFVDATTYATVCNACVERFREWYPDLERLEETEAR